MTDRVAIAALVEKLRKGEIGEDIDHAVARLFGTGRWVRCEGEPDVGVWGDREFYAPRYSISRDAVATLQTELLPGWHIRAISRSYRPALLGWVWRCEIGNEEANRCVFRYAPTEAAARLAAVLSAYAAPDHG